MNDTIIERGCAWAGCKNRVTGKGKYCPSCSAIARAKMKDLFAKSAAEKEEREAKHKALYDKGVAAGLAAMAACNPTPMVVQRHASPLDDSSPVVQEWFVPQGPCGFAWVTIFPANSSFAIWLKKNTGAGKAYHGGMQIWVEGGGQSVQLKMAYAHAMAKVFQEAGIKAYAGDRLD